MSCRGVHFALTPDQEARVISLAKDKDDPGLIDFIQMDIEESWDEEWLCETDKAWDAIHRCLTDGTLDETPATLGHLAILGGRSMYGSDDYIVKYLTSDEVLAVTGVLEKVTHGSMRENYLQIDPDAYGVALDDADWDYTWGYFESLREFFVRAATGSRSVIFSVDQ